MKCLILASGQGQRLRKVGEPKPIIPLLGLPLLERVIITAYSAQINEFYIVVGYQAEKIKNFLQVLAKKRNLKITLIFNPSWQRKNGLSVLAAKNFIKEKFILLMADHIVDSEILLKIKEEKIANDEVILAVDYKIKNNPLVDLEDVTKVLVREGRVVNIGKRIEDYNGFDTGIFLCSPKIFQALEENLENANYSLSGGINTLARQEKIRAIDIGSYKWVDVDNEEMYRKTEKLLLSNLKKVSDGPVARYVNRPISAVITKWLVKTSLTPNAVSIFSFILSLAGAGFFFFYPGNYLALICGAVIVQLSSIFDGCDGEIARLKVEESKFGSWFDAVLDRYGDAFVLGSLTFYVYVAHQSIWSLLIGFLAIIGSFMNSYTADKYDGIMKEKFNKKKGYFRFGHDVRIFIIFVFSLLNLPFFALVAIALIANIENIRRIFVAYKNS